jgi:hypothetical protein
MIDPETQPVSEATEEQPQAASAERIEENSAEVEQDNAAGEEGEI